MQASHEFIDLACRKGVLRFGSFITKAGRDSPYFFNAGLFDDGASFRELCGFYAGAIRASGVACDMLFGPAYKGIPLVAGVAIRLAEQGVNLPFCFNRKEAKDHGEGGVLIGAPLAGRVLILDDVISAGTSVRESVEAIRAGGAEPAGVVIALDRMERGTSALSAVQEVRESFGMPVIAVATLDDLTGYLADSPELAANLDAVTAYRKAYGVSSAG
ncbi:MAG TPA: orotate phosphoribosyltransferase [Rhodocyclaceae bacterium]|nr:orotate phosphoribosyltransferase [Rhodocyclaceae bacterium]